MKFFQICVLDGMENREVISCAFLSNDFNKTLNQFDFTANEEENASVTFIAGETPALPGNQDLNIESLKNLMG